MHTPRTVSGIGVLLIALFVASTASGQTITGKWIDSASPGSPLFTVTFGADGSYRAECRDESVCSFCSGIDLVVETGTYSITDGVMTIEIEESNAPNSSLRIGSTIRSAITQSDNENLTLANAPLLTFDWADTPSVQFTLTATGIKPTTWRAVKELFK